eukprot:GEMP01027874.1.p1 GENE.GEMP01027874.1~~GEMP01027874.1.p1  ORF type:complete len:485 (+),score=94.68 GEMP01027874.1:357-1811(+)
MKASGSDKFAHNEDADIDAYIDKLLAQMSLLYTSESSSKVMSSFELAAKDIHRTIGLGKFGRVFVAKDADSSGSGAVLAVKEILAPSVFKEFTIFKAAITSLMPTFAKLRHPNIAQVYRYELIVHPQQPRRLIIFREFCPGKSMSARIRSETLSDDVIRKYSRQLTDAVAHLHTRKPSIFHGEIKLSNMLISDTGDLKLSDIGMCQVKSSATIALSGSNTMELRYMAPESLLSGDKGCAQDIWSVGCAVIEMCSGKHPWESANAQNIADIYRLVSDPAALPDIPTDRPAAIVNFIENCIRRDVSQRMKAEKLQKHTWFKYPIKDDDQVGIYDHVWDPDGRKSGILPGASLSCFASGETSSAGSDDDEDESPTSGPSSATGKVKVASRKKRIKKKGTKQTMPNPVLKDLVDNSSIGSDSPSASLSSPMGSSPPSSKKSARRKTTPAGRAKGKPLLRKKSTAGAKKRAVPVLLQDTEISDTPLVNG